MSTEYDERLRDMSEYDRGYKAGLHARDTATWQLDRERAEVRERLASFDEDEMYVWDVLNCLFDGGVRPYMTKAIRERLMHLLETTVTERPENPTPEPTAITSELRAWIDGHQPSLGGDVALDELDEIAGRIDVTHLALLREFADFERLNDVVSVEHTKLKQAIGTAKNRFDTLADDFERCRNKLASEGYYSRLYNQAWSKWTAAGKRVEELEELLRDARDDYADLERRMKEAGRVAPLPEVSVAAGDTPEAIVRDLLNGAATRHEAVDRIHRL